MKRILVMIDWFEPAYKAGGPVRTVSNMVKLLQDHYEISIFTSDRDLGENETMPELQVNKWISFDSRMKIFYATPDQLSWSKILGLIRSIDPDFIYSSGMFSKYSSIYPAMMKRLGKYRARLILSPHGMLKPSALSFKPLKKLFFLEVYKLLHIPQRIRFHATDMSEVENITDQFGDVEVLSAIDAPAPLPAELEIISKSPGYLSILFVGRVHPVKNLLLLLTALKEVRSKIKLTIIGPIEDPAYWEACNDQIKKLPENIVVDYLGEVRHEKVLSYVFDHHIFSLPTKGENFGHSIYEALSCGRPVLISDQTPWRNLAENMAGWDIPNGKIEEYIRAIEDAAAWNEHLYSLWVKGARNYVEQKINFQQIVEQYNKLFS
jgi:glycosyltransferase involved in cell wall biosynthesis